MGVTILNHDYQIQKYGWNCGPTATRCALSTRGILLTQDQLIRECRTTTNGTDSINQILPVLNKYTGAAFASQWIVNDPPTPTQIGNTWNNICESILAGYGVVCNIVAPPNNHPPGYPNTTIWHYIAVVGVNTDNKQVYVADSAYFSGITHYWLTIQQLTSMITPKGYAFGPAENIDVQAVTNFVKTFVAPLISDTSDVRTQLCGAPTGYPGWKHLDNKTFVDGLADYRNHLVSAAQ
jgi:hypothetical protein